MPAPSRRPLQRRFQEWCPRSISGRLPISPRRACKGLRIHRIDRPGFPTRNECVAASAAWDSVGVMPSGSQGRSRSRCPRAVSTGSLPVSLSRTSASCCSRPSATQGRARVRRASDSSARTMACRYHTAHACYGHVSPGVASNIAHETIVLGRPRCLQKDARTSIPTGSRRALGLLLGVAYVLTRDIPGDDARFNVNISAGSSFAFWLKIWAMVIV